MNVEVGKKRIVSALILAGISFAWQSCSQQSKIQRYLHLAHENRVANQYDRAEIQYLNVLQLDARNAEANSQLASILFEQGRITRAVPFLRIAKELNPSDSPSGIRLGRAFVSLGQSKLARDEALQVLSREPENGDALLLLADASISHSDVEGAQNYISRVQRDGPAGPAALVARGTLELRLRNAPAAEASFNAALKLDAAYGPAHAGLGALYWGRHDFSAAEREFTAAAKQTPPRSPLRLKLAQFLLQSGDRDHARSVLEEMVHVAPDYIPGLVLLEEVAIDQGRNDEAATTIATVLSRDPGNSEARLDQARLDIHLEQYEKARIALLKLSKDHPHSAPIYYQLAVAQLASGSTDDAVASLNRALTFDPSLTDAIVLLAGIQVQQKNYSAPIPSLQQLVKTRPDLAQPRMLLANALLGTGQIDDALRVYHELEVAFPQNAQVDWLIALAQIQRGDKAAAWAALDHALHINPNYLPAVEQQVRLELSEGKTTAARKRMDDAISRNPKVSELYILLSQVEAARKNPSGVEDALQMAIRVNPESSAAYFTLAQYYFETGQTDHALARLSEILAKNPKDTEALMLSAAIEEKTEKYASARAHYETVLEVNNKFAACLNNLAYLYSERFNLIDKAYDAANQARQLLPNDPNVTDTYAWVLYKRGQYAWALGLLRQSAARLTQSADAQSHYGLAAYMMGEEDAARSALEASLHLDDKFPLANEVRQALAILSIDPNRPVPRDRPKLQARLHDSPRDVCALLRLGALSLLEGNTAAAKIAFEDAQRASPESAKPPLALAHFYSFVGDTGKALESAKYARKVAPSNLEAAWVLGRIADRSGDHLWAVSLLEECVTPQTADPERIYDLAMALYNVGRETEAVAAVERALSIDSEFKRAPLARRFLQLVQIAKDGQPRPESNLPIEGPPSEPVAVVAEGSIRCHRGDREGAIAVFERKLQQDHQLIPVQKRLALLYAESRRDDKAALDFVSKARAAQPEDAALTKALAGMLYQRSDYASVVGLLEESSVQATPDGESLYWLGSAKFQLKDIKGGQSALNEALRFTLPPALAQQCRETLAKIEANAGPH